MLSKKYLFSSLFVFVLFTLFSTIKAEATLPPTMSIGSVSVSAGENISIPINITNAVDVKSISFNVVYNLVPENNIGLLTYTGYTADYPETGTTTVTTSSGGTGLKITSAWVSDTPIDGSFTPITLNFTVKTPLAGMTLPAVMQFGGLSGLSVKDSLDFEIKNNFTFNDGSLTTLATLSSINITNPADRLSYYIGDTLDITGLEVTGTNSDGSISIQTITTDNISGFDSSSTVDGQVLTITVDGQTATYTVNITEVPIGLSSMTITNPANKLSYLTGDVIDITGLEVTGTYSDDSTQIQTITTDNISGFDSSSAVSGQIIVITVDGVTARYEIDIIAKPIIEIGSVAVLPGDTISLPITIYNGVDVKDISFNLIYNGDLLTYTGYTANYPSNGRANVTSPVVAGQGMRITAAWSGDSSLNGDVNPINLNFTVSSPITVSLPYSLNFGGLSGNSIKNNLDVEIKNDFSFNNGVISATPVELSSISITNPANKLSYYTGQSLDIRGLEVTGTNNDNSTQIQTITTDNISGFDSSSAVSGQVLTINVDGVTTTYEIDIRRRSSGGSGGGSVSVNNNTLNITVTPAPVQEKLTLNNNYQNINPIKITQKLILKTENKIFRNGSRNEDVKTIQSYLNSNGYDCGIADGIFGNKTKGAVISFQLAHGLTPDGIVGPMTLGVMR